MILLRNSTITSLQNKMVELGPRLSCAASMVRGSTKIVDIGTDHAYLPAYLVLCRNVNDVLACDIGIKPLENARKTVDLYSLQNHISLRVSDGLNEVLPDEAEEIIICGMGGTLISEILSHAEWIKRDGMHLILQPMTHSEDVRYWLCRNGFAITDEMYMVDNNRYYCCLSADYTGIFEEHEEGFYYFGELSDVSEPALAYAGMRMKRIETKLNALQKADPDAYELHFLQKIKEYYEKRMPH